MEITIYKILFVLLTFISGFIIGKIFERNYWVMKGNPHHRSSIYVNEKFWYVVSEQEYCQFIFYNLKEKMDDKVKQYNEQKVC